MITYSTPVLPFVTSYTHVCGMRFAPEYSYYGTDRGDSHAFTPGILPV